MTSANLGKRHKHERQKDSGREGCQRGLSLSWGGSPRYHLVSDLNKRCSPLSLPNHTVPSGHIRHLFRVSNEVPWLSQYLRFPPPPRLFQYSGRRQIKPMLRPQFRHSSLLAGCLGRIHSSLLESDSGCRRLVIERACLAPNHGSGFGAPQRLLSLVRTYLTTHPYAFSVGMALERQTHPSRSR